MKILEIITTDRLDEALPGSVQAAQALSHLNPMNWIRSGVAKMTSGGFNKHLSVTDLINDTASGVAKYARERGQSIADAAEAYREKLAHQIDLEVEHSLEARIRTGKIPDPDKAPTARARAEAMQAIQRDREQLEAKAWDRLNPNLAPKNKNFWAAVQKKAEREFGANMLAGVGKGASGVVGMTGKLIKLGVNAAYAAQILQPFKDYSDRMAVADQWLKSGQIPPGQGEYKDVKEWYTAYRSQELTYAISQSAITVATAAIGGAVIGGLLKKFTGVTGAVGPVWTTLGTAGKAYLASKVRDSETAKSIATVIADNAGLVGGVAGAAVDATGAGPLGTIVIDAVTYLNRIGQDAKAADEGKKPEDGKSAPAGDKSKSNAIDQTSQTGEKPTPNAQVDASKPTAAAEPAKPYDFMGAKPVDPRWAPKEKWKDLGNGYIQDPNTGTIDVRL
jgi:hypothetical protein